MRVLAGLGGFYFLLLSRLSLHPPSVLAEESLYGRVERDLVTWQSDSQEIVSLSVESLTVCALTCSARGGDMCNSFYFDLQGTCHLARVGDLSTMI